MVADFVGCKSGLFMSEKYLDDELLKEASPTLMLRYYREVWEGDLLDGFALLFYILRS